MIQSEPFKLINIMICDYMRSGYSDRSIHILCLGARPNLLNSNLLISQISSLNVKLQRLTDT